MNVDMHLPWTLKYKPKTLAEVVGNKKAKEMLLEWIKSWEKGIPAKRAAFLYGPPGVGKTAAVEALAHDLNMELVEMNASDYRTEDAVKRVAGLASQYGTLFGRRRIILMDELDGLTGREDRGGLGALIKVIRKARCPIVLIATNAYDPRFITLRNLCLLIPFKRVRKTEVVKHLERICRMEGIEAEPEALKFIAERSGGDVRSAVNDLQALAQGRRRLTYEDVAWLSVRDRKESIFNVLALIFHAQRCLDAKRAVDMADVDPDMLFEWVYENAPRFLTDPHDLADAMDALSMADVFRGRVRKTQSWGLLSYFLDLMTAGVAMSRDRTKPKWTKSEFPKRIQMMSRTKEVRGILASIGMQIRRKCHISAKRAASEVIPYLRVIFENNPEMAAGLAQWLELDEKMVTYLAGSERNAKKIIAHLKS